MSDPPEDDGETEITARRLSESNQVNERKTAAAARKLRVT